MKLQTSLIAVKRIESDQPIDSFPKEKIEIGAFLIQTAEGTINPLIVERNGVNTYKVIDGHFVYHCAVRAREIDPIKGEYIQAIIMDEENEDSLKLQIRHFR